MESHNIDRNAMGKRNAGFTLVEMAIVLVIIGIILAAVSIGKDAERNAEYKNVAQGFVQPWLQAYNAYYDRVHVPVGDNTANATQRVGGCLGNDCAYPAPALGGALETLMSNTGISMPEGIGGATVAHQQQFRYRDQAGIAHTAQLWFEYHRNPQYGGAGTMVNLPTGNVMRLHNVVPELANMLDSYADGNANLAQGSFQCGTPNGPWGLDAPVAVDRDEQQSTDYDCVWKMSN